MALLSREKERSTRAKSGSIQPHVIFGAVSFGLGIIGALAFTAAGIAKEFSILGGTGVAIVVSLFQIRHAVLSSERNAIRRAVAEAQTLNESIQALSIIRAEVFRATERDTLESARRLQEKATRRIAAMWTVMHYSDVLGEYLERTTNDFVQGDQSRAIQRIIDLENDLDEIEDHLRRTWAAVCGNQYEVAFAGHIELEMLIIDDRRAALFLQPGRGYDCVHLEGEDPGFVAVVGRSFQQVWSKAATLPRNLITQEPDWGQLHQWLAQEKEARVRNQ